MTEPDASSRSFIAPPPDFPRTENKVAQEACYALACQIAGKEPPPWFVEHLERSVCCLAMNRHVDQQRLKSGIKNTNKKLEKTIVSLKTQLEDPIIVLLLNEQGFKEEHKRIMRWIKTNEPLTQTPLAGIRTIYTEISDIKEKLDKLSSQIEFALALPELHGRGPEHVYLQGVVPPMRLCALHIIVAVRRFKLDLPSKREMYRYAQTLWQGSQTALLPHLEIENDFPSNADDKLRKWELYFKLDCDTYISYEDCRLQLAMAMMRAGLPFSREGTEKHDP